MPKRDEPTLRSLTHAVDDEVFRRKYFAQRLLVSHGAVDRFASLLEARELKDVESAARACRTRVRVWSRGVDVPVDGLDALAFYRAGMTLYMWEVERFIPAVDRLVRRIAADLGIRDHECDGELIASKPGAGAAMHFDSDDGFNIQLRGQKRWRTAPNRWVVHPLVSYGVGFPDIGKQLSAHGSGRFPTRMPANARTDRVRPGSVVYLPRGTWHETHVIGTEESLALVVNLRVPTWADRVTEALKRRLQSVPRFRESAYETGDSIRATNALLNDAVGALQQITQPELFSDPSPYLFAHFSPIAPGRCTLKSSGAARHTLTVTRARHHPVVLVFENRALARTLQRLLSRDDIVYGATLLGEFSRDSHDLGQALKLLVRERLLRRYVESTVRPAGPIRST